MTREQEAQIVRKVLQGDVNAFEDLVLEYEKNVYGITLRMTGNSEDAADMTQETFIKAFNSLQSFRGDSKFSVWLYRIATNVCLDFLRSRNRKPTVSLSVERRGLDALSPEYRQILLLREIQGLSYEEISQVLSLEVGTVKSRIFRARKRLCAFLIADGNIPEITASVKQEGGEKT